MIYNIIPLLIILVSLAVIIVVIIRKFPQLASLDLSTLPQERDKKVKKDIVERRLQRVLHTHKNTVGKFFAPVGRKIYNFFKKTYTKAYRSYKEIETKQIHEASRDHDKAADAQVKKEDLIASSLANGESFLKDEKYAEAEERFIDVISLDKKNFEAYNGLAQVYLAQKEFDKVKETLIYLLRLAQSNPDVSERQQAIIHFELSEIYQSQDEGSLALEHIKEALELEPNNPRYLDTLVQIAIMLQDVSLAKEAFMKLSEVNPDNQKLEDLAQTIDAMA